MNYITVWETAQQNQLVLLRNLFEQEKLDFRILDQNTNNNFATGARVQVEEKDKTRAEAVLRDNGFLEARTVVRDDVSSKRFWIWFFAALLILIIAAALINELMS